MSHFLVQKNPGIFEIYDVSARTRGELSQCEHFSDKERVNFSRFYADVFYGRPLKSSIENFKFLGERLTDNRKKGSVKFYI